MRIQINSDKNITVDDRVISFVRGKADRALSRYEGRLTRVEFHLSDVNSHKFGAKDKRCVAEARPAGRKPLVVTTAAANIRSAVQGSLSKLQSALEKYFGRSARVSRAKASVRPVKTSAAAAAAPKGAAKKKTTAGKAATPVTASAGRSPKKKAIYQARRKSWPARAAA